MAIKRMIWADDRDGGAAGAMDSYPSASLTTGSSCIVVDDGPSLILYRYSETETGADDGDLIIAPDDIGASPGRWVKVTVLEFEITEVYNTSGTLAIGTNTTGIQLFSQGAFVNEFSTDGTLAGDSDSAVPTEQAVKEYVDTRAPEADGSEDKQSELRTYDVVSGIQVVGPWTAPNLFDNPSFSLRQKYGSGTITTFNNDHFADRWFAWTAAGTMTIVRNSARYYLSDIEQAWDEAVAFQSNGTGTPYALVQRFPSDFIRSLAGNVITISVFCYSNVSSLSMAMGLVYGATTATSYRNGEAKTLVTAGQYRRLSTTFTMPNITGTEAHVVIYLCYGFGSMTSGQYIYFAAPKMEINPYPTRHIAQVKEQAYPICAPYYQKSFALDTRPAYSTFSTQQVSAAFSTTESQAWIQFNHHMRSTPTVILYGESSTGYWQQYRGGWISSTAQSQTGVGPTGFNLNVGGTFTTYDATLIRGDWTADCNL